MLAELGDALEVIGAWCTRSVAGAEGTQRGALSTVVCPYAGWLSHGDHGVGAVCPVVSVQGFGFRA